MLVPYYSTTNPSLVLFSLHCTRNLFFHLCTRFLFTPGGRNTLQYREAVIQNFANKIVDVWHSFNQLEICIKKVYHKLTWRLFLLTKKLLILLTNPGILFLLAFFTFIVLVQKSCIVRPHQLMAANSQHTLRITYVVYNVCMIMLIRQNNFVNKWEIKRILYFILCSYFDSRDSYLLSEIWWISFNKSNQTIYLLCLYVLLLVLFTCRNSYLIQST